mmetsp:Transcript_60199/g.155012  ORF Transcript_60199/g.155012 Transcript_60199/m.155012 type:complete len:272 (+) Transcript_60199:136-951(+)
MAWWHRSISASISPDVPSARRLSCACLNASSKTGCDLSGSWKISKPSSILRLLGISAKKGTPSTAMCTLRCAMRFLKQSQMRLARITDTRLLRKNSRIFASSCTFCRLMFRSRVIAAVMLLRNVEKVTSAKSTTTQAKRRSSPVCGAMFCVAGVNCVSDQCSDVRYLYAILSISLKWLTSIQLRRAPSSLVVTPIKCQAQAMMWLMPSKTRMSFQMSRRTWMNMESMRSTRDSMMRCSLTRRSSRTVLSTRRMRSVLPMRAMPTSRVVDWL